MQNMQKDSTRQCCYLNEIVKQTCVECLGQRVTRLHRLLTVQSDHDVLRLSTPLAVHRPTGQFRLQVFLAHSKQVRRKL